MKRLPGRLLALLLALLLLSSACLGAGVGPFAQLREYDETFLDVPEEVWFYPYVVRAYELGLMKGKGEGLFNPEGDITLAEALTVACNILNTYLGGEELTNGTPWYQTYVDYAAAHGLLPDELFTLDYGDPAVRSDLAQIFAGLPAELLEGINTIEEDAIPDVYEDDPFRDPVYTLYKAGILTGVDEEGAFNPFATITRAEVATIAARVADPSLRITGDLIFPEIPSEPMPDLPGETPEVQPEGTVAVYSDNGRVLYIQPEEVDQYLAWNWRTERFPAMWKDPKTDRFTDEEKIALMNTASLLPMKTNNPELDAKVEEIFARILRDDMTTYEKVMACYDYLVDNTYYGRSSGTWYRNYAEYQDGTIVSQALACLKNGAGACNHYASAFQVMTRRIGLQSWYYHCNGGSASGGGGHYYNVIDLHGVPFTFDAQVDDKMAAKGMPHWYWFKSYVEISKAYLRTEQMPFGYFQLK